MIEHDLRASGRLRLLLVLNLSRFLAARPPERTGEAAGDLGSARAMFNHLRGGESFVAALRGWRPAQPFERDRDQDRSESEGYRLGVFRSRLLQRQFLPTYRMRWTPEMLKELRAHDPGLVDEWTCWEPRLRFTPYGLAVVSLERRMEAVPLIGWSERLLELQCDRHIKGEETLAERQAQWWLSRWVLTHFLESVGWQLSIGHHDEPEVIRFQKPVEENRPLRLDRYALYLWDRVEHTRGDVTPQELKGAYAQALAGLLEGALVVEGDQRRYPIHAAESLRYDDLSNWQEELCLLTGEGALIYTPLLERGVALMGGSHDVVSDAYGSYWAAIVRGIELIVSFRAEAERSQRRTIDLLSMVPHLTQKVNDGRISASDEREIATMAGGLADIFDTLPEQRSMAISALFFRSDMARRKFDVLMDRLDIRKILEQIDTNVEQISFFLGYYNDMRLQWQSQRINTMAWRVALLLLFMAASSFLADAFELLDHWHMAVGPLTVGDWSMATLVVLGCAVLLWYFNDRRR